MRLMVIVVKMMSLVVSMRIGCLVVMKLCRGMS